MGKFIAAWRMVTIVPLISREGEDYDLNTILPFLPIVGLALGAIGWAVATVLLAVAREGVAAAVGAFVVSLGLWWLTGMKGLRGFFFTAKHWTEVGADGPDEYSFYATIFAVQSVVLGKLMLVGVLISMGEGIWLPVTLALSWCGCAEMFAAPQPAEPSKGRSFPQHWIVGAVAAIVVATVGGHLIAGVLAVGLAWLIVPALSRALRRRLGEADTNGVYATVEITELCVLLLGVLHFASA